MGGNIFRAAKNFTDEWNIVIWPEIKIGIVYL